MRSLITLMLILLSAACFAIEEKQEIDVIAVDYPPYTSPTLPSYGSNFSLLSEYAKSHFRISIKPFFLPPARANRLIKDGNWCISFYPPNENNKSARFVALSSDNVSIGFYRLQQQGQFKWQSLNELNGKMVALLRSNHIGKMHEHFINAGIQLVYVESVEQGLRQVLKGRVDYAFGDELALLEAQLSEAQRQKLQFSESVVHKAKIGFFYNTECKNRLFNTTEK